MNWKTRVRNWRAGSAPGHAFAARGFERYGDSSPVTLVMRKTKRQGWHLASPESLDR